MNVDTLFTLMKIRSMKAAELARQAGVSRQALSAWRRRASEQGKPNIDVLSTTQDRIAEVLGVRSEELSRSIGVLATTKQRKIIETNLLWDKMFPNVEVFAVAVVKGELNALGRLVQTYGLYDAAKMAGRQIWQKFPLYKSRLHPGYRKQAEVVWTLEQNQT